MATAARRFPVMEGILPIDRTRVPMDIAAGVTLAALGIPEVMGYTSIAGMPVITGLYTILIPIAVIVWIVAVVAAVWFHIRAAMAANRGEVFRYPWGIPVLH